MATHTTAATSWGATGYVRDNELRAKADAANASDKARLARLPTRCKAWSDRLDVPALEVMSVVAKHYETNGMAPTRISTGDIARALKINERDAEVRLERLVREGAVQRTRRLADAPVYTPLARGPVAVVTKAQRDLAEVRDMAEDALRASKGQEPVQRAEAATSTFPAGSVMRGLRGRA